MKYWCKNFIRGSVLCVVLLVFFYVYFCFVFVFVFCFLFLCFVCFVICLFCFDLFVVHVVRVFRLVWICFVFVCRCCFCLLGGDSLLCLCVLLFLFLFAVVFVYCVVLGGVVCVLPFGCRNVVVCDWRLLILLELVVLVRPVRYCCRNMHLFVSMAIYFDKKKAILRTRRAVK